MNDEEKSKMRVSGFIERVQVTAYPPYSTLLWLWTQENPKLCFGDITLTSELQWLFEEDLCSTLGCST